MSFNLRESFNASDSEEDDTPYDIDEDVDEDSTGDIEDTDEDVDEDSTEESLAEKAPKGEALKHSVAKNTSIEQDFANLHGLSGSSSQNNTVEDNAAGPSAVQPRTLSPPEGLTEVELMEHQRSALTWLIWREQQKPPGGILADDMGLGKTLTMISLILKSRELYPKDDDIDKSDLKSAKKYKGGTLIVCTKSVLHQWQDELLLRTKKKCLSSKLHYGTKRETDAEALSKCDVVFTTYRIVCEEFKTSKTVFNVNWSRIIIDEAHRIRNSKSESFKAVCELHSKYRWAVTGTPVHNKESDMYSLIKFLKCTPFDLDRAIWKRLFKSEEGRKLLRRVISSIMLRRTKEELSKTTLLKELPKRTYELIPVSLVSEEREVYDKILIFSKTLFAQFLQQQNKGQNKIKIDEKTNEEYFRRKLLKLKNLKDIKSKEILVLLLRLNQLCNHPSLIMNMLSPDDRVNLSENDVDELERLFSGLTLSEQLLNLLVFNDPTEDINDGESSYTCLKDAANDLLKRSHPIFKTTMSSKMRKLFELIEKKLLNNDDKAIVVSQWPSFLKLIADQLEEKNIQFCQLDGKVPASKRKEIIDQINDPKEPVKILLLSSTAGGEGLNLIGANHLFILDFHLNPQIDNLVMDRIYRIGQKKPVFIYKLMAEGTIEEKMFKLYQEKKLNIANDMLTGTNSMHKITLEDMKKFFEGP